MVFPSTLLRNTGEDAPYCFAVGLPGDIPGLRFICRETADYGRSHFDHPLGSRFDEVDGLERVPEFLAGAKIGHAGL